VTIDPHKVLKYLICEFLDEENIPFDTGVPLERNLLIPLLFAMASSDAVSFVPNPVESVLISEEYESSDEMLHRLIFNVLTAPSIHLCGSPNLIDPACHLCEIRLLEVILRESGADNQVAFAKGAVS
jgi:hypothetical protein